MKMVCFTQIKYLDVSAKFHEWRAKLWMLLYKPFLDGTFSPKNAEIGYHIRRRFLRYKFMFSCEIVPLRLWLPAI